MRDWRSELSKALGEPLSDRAWDRLNERGDIEELERTPEVFGVKVKELRKDRAAWRDRARVHRGRPALEITRAEAVSRAYAALAAEEEEVRKFRGRELDGKLLRADDVEPWIMRRRTQDRGPTHLIEVAGVARSVVHSRDGMRFRSPMTGPITSVSSRFLAYPKAGWTHYMPVHVDGVLDQLRALTESLTSRYGWQPAQATAFVLTDAVPVLGDVRARKHTSWPSGLVRITLDVDPRVSPRELAAQYSTVRRETVGPRHRDMTPKHLRLAVFYAECPDGETWSTRMAAWNASVESRVRWRYSRAENFARDATRALERVLGRDLRP